MNLNVIWYGVMRWVNKMTATCPMCNAKWNEQDEDYGIILRCGTEHDILCKSCDKTITYVMIRGDLEIAYSINLSTHTNMIVNLEKKLLATKRELEESAKKVKGILEGTIK